MEDNIKQIAARLKGLRDVLEITEEQLAERCHFNADEYRMYESGHQDIPIGVLHTIAHTYEIELTALLTGEEPHMHAYSLTRKLQAPEVIRSTAYKYQALAPNFINRKGNPFMVTVAPKNEDAPIHLNSHIGQEFNHILKGRLKLLLNGKEMILEEGDSIYFDSSLPHGMIALDERECQFLAIIL